MPEFSLFQKCLVGALGLGSLLVWAKIATLLWHRRPVLESTRYHVPNLHWLSLAMTMAWVGMNMFMVLSSPVRTDSQPDVQGVQASILELLILLFVCGVPLFLQKSVPIREYGFHLHNPGRQAAEGGLGFLASVIPVCLFWAATLRWRTTENQHGLLRLLSEDDSIRTLLLILLLAGVLAPLVEELMYRVVLQTALEKIASPREAIIIVALIFSAMHQLPDAIPLFPLALILGYTYHQRRSFLSIVLIHMLFNATNLLFLLLTRAQTAAAQ